MYWSWKGPEVIYIQWVSKTPLLYLVAPLVSMLAMLAEHSGTILLIDRQADTSAGWRKKKPQLCSGAYLRGDLLKERRRVSPVCVEQKPSIERCWALLTQKLNSVT